MIAASRQWRCGEFENVAVSLTDVSDDVDISIILEKDGKTMVEEAETLVATGSKGQCSSNLLSF